MLLLLTCEDDIHADAVILALGRLKPDFQVVRINTDHLPTNVDYCFLWQRDGSFATRRLGARDSGLTCKQPTVVWYRKPEIPRPHPAISDPNAIECCRHEWREFLHAFQGFFPDARWVNDYWRMQRCAIKPFQIHHARRVGLAIPETLITNDLDALANFTAMHPEVIIKPMYFSGYRAEGKHYACYTSVLTPERVAEIPAEQLQYAPAIVQRRIPKNQELRVTIIGDRLFPCEIMTSPESPQHVDWRIDDPEELPHRLVALPTIVETQLRQMLVNMGLNYGAVDLIRDDNGTYFFIEINPNGQFYWIELLTKAELSDEMARLILRLSVDAH
jgi:glutathione synthase/RimK-type ligase-like ATP-grasp enzyme